MSTPKRLLLVGLAVVGLGAINLLFAAAPTDVKLTVYDHVAKPGEKATLRAKLEHDGALGVNPDLKGYPLLFTGALDLRIEKKTEKDGVAVVTTALPDKPPNPYSYQVAFAGSKNHKPAERAGIVFIWPEDSPILVTDIDHTISDFSQLKLATAKIEDMPPLKGAPEALTELAKSYRIVYLTAREDALNNKTKDWLKLKGFPDGPLFTRDNLFATSQEGFKTEFLKKFRERYPKLLVGVAERPEDARAYLENKMTPYMIDPKGKETYPKGSIVVKSWDEIQEKLKPPPN